jgi:GT2 family glycosyltransferase
VGPLLVAAPAPLEVLSAGGVLEPLSWDPVHLREPRFVADWEEAGPGPREWLDGACLLVRAAALAEVGPFDEEYVHSFADVDHHLRLRARGWGVECVPAALASREPDPVGGEGWVGDRLRFLARHAPRSVLAREVARQAREAARDLGRGDGERAAGRARGTARFLSRRRGPFPEA